MTKQSVDELAEELGIKDEPVKKAARAPRDARILAGFEDILKFVEENGRPPAHGEDKDIFERLYAVRLDRLRAQADCRDLLAEFDKNGLLGPALASDEMPEEPLDDDTLSAALGIETVSGNDITDLKHVKSRVEVKAAEEIANRAACEDFENFKPLFALIHRDMDAGTRETRRFGKDAEIKQGEFFILNGQTAYVAEVGEEERRTKTDRPDRRLRVIYDNGTESDILLRSLQRALYKDEAGRRITDPSSGPLFGSELEQEDTQSGTIYVLRSLSDHPVIVEAGQVIHKIGVTGGEVEARIANAKQDATFLFADVEIVATYKLANINRTKLESLLHRFFSAVRFDLEFKDRFGRPVKPREWFLVSPPVIDQVIEKIMDQTITQYVYNPTTASLEKIAGD